MQVELNVTQENIDANEKHFDSLDLCPIAIAMRGLLRQDSYISVRYNRITIGAPIDNNRYDEKLQVIPFTDDVPDAYTNNEKQPLTPFTTMLDIPEQFLRELTPA
jgi:hypothetical protein